MKMLPALDMREVEVLTDTAFPASDDDRGRIFCYVGFCETQDEETYVQAYLRDALAEPYETGAPMPNGERAEQSMSQDLMEPMPAHPRMNVLATCHHLSVRLSLRIAIISETPIPNNLIL